MKDYQTLKEQLSKIFSHLSSDDENKKLLEELNESNEKLTAGRYWFYGTITVFGSSVSEPWMSEQYQKVMKRIRTRILKKYIGAFAASVLILLSLGSMIRYSGVWSGSSEWQEIALNRGEQRKVTLSDGSIVFLAPSTIFKFPEKFSGSTREVQIWGEGYFEVMHDKEKPFIVKTPRSIVTVKGTAFNIRALEEEKYEEIILVEGSVALTYFDREQTALNEDYIIKPMQKVIFDKEKNTNRVVKIGLSERPKWMEGEISFRNESFEKLVKELERFHDVDIIIEDQQVFSNQLNGDFNNESITEILNTLEILVPMKYKYDVQTQTVIIMASESK